MTPSDEGRSYLNVQVNGTWEGQPFTKAMSIPVQVGEGGPTLATNGEANTMSPIALKRTSRRRRGLAAASAIIHRHRPAARASAPVPSVLPLSATRMCRTGGRGTARTTWPIDGASLSAGITMSMFMLEP